MTEQEIYQSIAWPLAAVCALYFFPVSIWKFTQQIKAIKLGAPLEVEEENSIPSNHINFIDVGILLAITLYALLGSKSSGGGEITKETLITGILSQLCLIGFVALIWGFRINLIEAFSLKNIRGKFLIWCIIPVLTAWGVTAVAHLAGFFSLLESYYGKPPLQEAVILLQSSKDPITLSLIALLACIGAPLAEEVLFRGYVYPTAKRFSTPWLAMAFSGILFALIHYNLASLPTLVIMGILLALSYERTRCLWVPIIAHCIFNTATVGFQLLSRFSETPV